MGETIEQDEIFFVVLQRLVKHFDGRLRILTLHDLSQRQPV